MSVKSRQQRANAVPYFDSSTLRRRTVLKNVLISAAAVGAGFSFWVFKARAKRTERIFFHEAHSFRCAAGKWGVLDCRRIVLEPSEQIFPANHFAQPTKWFFKDHTQASAINFLISLGLSRERLPSTEPGLWTDGEHGVVFAPPPKWLETLTPEEREKIYVALAAWPEYPRYFDIFTFVPEYLEATLVDSGLPTETITLFRRLLYKRGKALAFTDVPLVLMSLPDDRSKERFLQILVRRPSLGVRLSVDSKSDINALANYWGAHGRENEVRAILQNAAHAVGGSSVDIATLLPHFVRDRLQSFPSSAIPAQLVQNCHWSSLNFFNEKPNDAFLYSDEVEREMTAHYVKIKTSPELGDLILFRDSSHAIVHSAAFIGDRIVFTKNGEGPSQPWAFMNVEDVVTCYSALMGPISVTVYRRNAV